MPLPTFVIAGAQKSGTTTLHDLLGQHPQVWVSDPKELHFFDKHHDRGLEWYGEQFRPAPEQVAWGESTPIYIYSDAARTRMVKALPTARFIVLLREPVARAYSQYWFARSKGGEPLASFAEAVAAEPARLSAGKRGQRARFSYLDRGRYVNQLQALERAVGRDHMLVFLTDDLSADSLTVLQRCCAFLGVDPEQVSPTSLRRSNTFANRTINSADAQRKPRVQERAQTVPTDAYPPIDPSLEEDLREGFADDNARLAKWLGRDLSSWLPR